VVPGEVTRPRVAILVACFNDAATIQETIDSLRDEPDSELVVVDDGSTDPDTLSALERLERDGIRVLRQENAGPSAAWMTGVEATSAPYVIPFSSDDVLLRGATAFLADALDVNPGASFAYGDIKTFGLATAYRPMAPVLCPWLVTYMHCLPAYSLFRRDELVASGGWQTTSASEDWDLWMRLGSQGRSGVHVPRPVYLYRRGSGGRFRRRGNRYEPFYEELRERNSELFAARAGNKRKSPAPRVLKILIPLVDKLPKVPRLKKMQITEALVLLFWSGGLRRTAQIVLEGVRFRVRVHSGA
jgi:glycosyltransferase involved in cell wall biosynthesis